MIFNKESAEFLSALIPALVIRAVAYDVSRIL